MKKKITGILATFMILVLAVTPVLADDPYTGADDLTVTFTEKGEVISSFSKGDLDKPLSALQPGDTAEFKITLINNYKDPTDWWMNNAIIRSLEESNGTATGGAYEYELVFEGPSGERTLYSSAVVGGEVGEGLYEATDALEEDFFLDTLSKGQTALVRLDVTLDGETQGNMYQDTLADLTMEFAVEIEAPQTITPTPPGKITQTPVPTGDLNDLVPYISALVAGAAILAIAIALVFRRRKEESK